MLTLNDVVMRIACLTEGLKLDRQTDFVVRSVEIRNKLETMLRAHGAKSDKFGDLTKAELNALIGRVMFEVTNFLDGWSTDYTAWAKDFIADDFEVRTDTYAAIKLGLSEAPTKKKKDALFAQMKSDGIVPIYGWAATNSPETLTSKIWNDPSGANGLIIPAFVNGFKTSATATIVNRIRQGWANNENTADVISASVGTGIDGVTSSVDRVINQSRAVIDTTVQQVDQMTSAQAGSSLTNRYMWCSVMDGRTTAICIGLNMQIFVFGVGPLPPAHIGCRSHILPLLQ